MSLFFNGREWVSPATMSAVDESRMYGSKPSGGNTLALVGISAGGQPKTALRFGSAQQARAVLVSGPLLDAVERAFGASSQSEGPAVVVAVRVSPATRSSLMLKDSLNQDCIALTSTNYGLVANGVKVKIEAGSTTGLRLTTMMGTDIFTVDNLSREVIGVSAPAAATATLTIEPTQAVITLAGVATTIDFNSFTTVQDLVDRLSIIAGVTARVVDGNGEKPTLNALDCFAAADIKTAERVVKANRIAAVEWFNSVSEGAIDAVSAVGATLAPAPAPYSQFTGGSQSSATVTDWANALSVLETEDVQWVVPLSGSPAAHAMVASHVTYMSGIGRKERRAICGTVSATTDTAAVAAAKAINSDRVSLTHLGIYDYNRSGALVLFEPFIAAAMIAAAFAGLNPGTPLTNKSLRIAGLERKLRNPTDTDGLIIGGVLCLEDTPTGYRVVKSISTWLNNDNYNRREVSVGVALDFTMRKVRDALDELRGAKNNPVTLNLAIEKTDTVLRALALPEPAGPAVLAGDGTNPAYRNIRASQVGDVLRVEFQASPVLPVNYIPVVCFAVPYTGSAAGAVI